MRIKLNRKILFAVFLCFSAASIFLIGECILTAQHYFKHNTLNRAKLIMLRESKLQKMTKQRKAVAPDERWENDLAIHPFFGYVWNPNLEGINNFGFKSEYDITISDSGYSLKQYIRDNPLTIGIFGGSFAEQLSAENKYLEKRLKEVFPGRKVVVINFAVGGYSLPQSAFIFIYFKELFDIIVFLDGVNELWNAVENNKAGCPPEYAKAFHFQYKLSLNELSPANFILTSKIIAMKKKLERITNISLLPGIRQSLLAHHIWVAFEKHLNYQISLQSFKIKNSYESGHKFFDMNDESILDHAASQWYNYHQLIHKIASSENILDIHFIQPNPYAKDSKVLTSDEVYNIEPKNIDNLCAILYLITYQ